MKQTSFLLLIIAVVLAAAACTQHASKEEQKKPDLTLSDSNGLSRIAMLTRYFEQFPPTPKEKAYLEAMKDEQEEEDISEGREELPE